jgi:hypothetical protein
LSYDRLVLLSRQTLLLAAFSALGGACVALKDQVSDVTSGSEENFSFSSLDFDVLSEELEESAFTPGGNISITAIRLIEFQKGPDFHSANSQNQVITFLVHGTDEEQNVR